MKKYHYAFLLLISLVGCKSESNTSKEGKITADENKINKLEKTKIVFENQSPCYYISKKEIYEIFGLSSSDKLNTEEDKTSEYEQCIYTYNTGYFQIVRHIGIPPPFKGDNKLYLQHIFKQYQNKGTQYRPKFERLTDIGFLAGWSANSKKIMGNSIEFVANNKRYTVYVKFIPNNTGKSKQKAIQIAKLIHLKNVK